MEIFLMFFIFIIIGIIICAIDSATSGTTNHQPKSNKSHNTNDWYALYMPRRYRRIPKKFFRF